MDKHKVLVVGGGGFIGRSIVSLLMKEGVSVTVLDIISQDVFAENLEWVVGTAEDESLLSSLARYSEVVIFLANNSLPASSNNNLTGEVLSHVKVSIRAAEICEAQGVKRFIYASSGGTVYGYDAKSPLSENDSTRPLNAYGVSKLTIENYLRILGARGLMDTVSLRISNPYGEWQTASKNQGFIAAAIRGALNNEPILIWGDGTIVRDFIYVEDVAKAFIVASYLDEVPNVVNIGSGIGCKLLDIIKIVEKFVGRDIPVIFEKERSVDVKSNVLDISLAKASLGWNPKIDIMEGIDRTVAWWRARD